MSTASDEQWRAAGMLRLPHGETRPERRYSMPDPDGKLFASYEAACRRLNPGCALEHLPDDVRLSRVELEHVLRLAGAYLDLTTYELGQEHCVGKLRDIWRARRARRVERGR